jgi:hypothetical protein
MVCKCIKEIVLSDGSKFINGNYYMYEFYNGNFLVKKPGKQEYKIPNYNQVMDEKGFNEYFVDISKVNKEVKPKVEIKGPSKISVMNIIDNSLIDLLKKGSGFVDTRENLTKRTVRLKESLEKDMKACELLKNVDPDILLYTPDFWKNVESSRVKYHIYYISHCLKRIEDINWCLKNRLRFYKYSKLQLFNLIKLKEKLSIENAKPVEEFHTKYNVII